MKYTDDELIAYLANETDAATRLEIAAWIEATPEARQRVAELRQLEQALAGAITYEPPADMLYEFRDRIAEERERSAAGPGWYRIAAAILLLVAGFGAGRYAALPVQPDGELGALKTEIRVLQQMVMLNTLREHTASERLQAINLIEDTRSAPDRELISTLATTMNYDENPNVRFAAVQALGRYSDQEDVRLKMVRSLGNQDDPLVQIALINVLTDARERAAIAPIKKLAGNDGAPVEVRRTAELALDVLI